MNTRHGVYIPYLRSLMADELLGVRHYCNKYKADQEVRHWMVYEVHNCFGRMDQHIRKFGLGILTGECEGAFPKKVPSSH